MTYLVTGVRGIVGRAVVDQLRAAGKPVRAASSRPADTTVPDSVELVGLDPTDPGSVATALAGIEKVFCYAAAEGIDNFIDAAKAAGIAHVVLLSSIAAADGHNPIGARHLAAENPLRASGLPLTVLRPGTLPPTPAPGSHHQSRPRRPRPLPGPATDADSRRRYRRRSRHRPRRPVPHGQDLPAHRPRIPVASPAGRRDLRRPRRADRTDRAELRGSGRRLLPPSPRYVGRSRNGAEPGRPHLAVDHRHTRPYLRPVGGRPRERLPLRTHPHPLAHPPSD